MTVTMGDWDWDDRFKVWLLSATREVDGTRTTWTINGGFNAAERPDKARDANSRAMLLATIEHDTL